LNSGRTDSRCILAKVKSSSIDWGKVMLYQLSYFRILFSNYKITACAFRLRGQKYAKF